MLKITLHLLLLASSAFAAQIDSQAQTTGEARGIALYWNDHVKDPQNAQTICQDFAKSAYKEITAQNICASSCINTFNVHLSKQEGR